MDVSPIVSYINTGFKGRKIYDPISKIFYVDKFKAVYDMMCNPTDDSALDESLWALKHAGEEQAFLEYCNQHKYILKGN
ncbi:MAG: hypothetical protein LBD63_01730 [Mycoplasmataceae bacterium]|nr:hypothetical protein [Mycoplasmataceae bacterium]